MKGNMRVYYDEEADYLDIFIGEPRPNYGVEKGKGITVFKDNETGEVIGIGILNFKKRSEDLKEIEIDLPIEIGLFSKK